MEGTFEKGFIRFGTTRVISLRAFSRQDDEDFDIIPKEDVYYIGRPGRQSRIIYADRGGDGYFGNPCGSPHKPCPLCDTKHYGRGDSIKHYRAWLVNEVLDNHEFRHAVRELRGKVLLCFCGPDDIRAGRCHGYYLAGFAETGRVPRNPAKNTPTFLEVMSRGRIK